jgi:hypothetical protein
MNDGHPRSYKRPQTQSTSQPSSKRLKKETSVKLEREERAAEQRHAKTQQVRERVAWVHTAMLWMYEKWMDRSAADDSDTTERARQQSPAPSTHFLPLSCCQCMVAVVSIQRLFEC